MNYSIYMDVQQEVKLVEKELVELIIEHLKVNRIAVETARQQAKDFLALLPINDKRDLLNKLKNLGEKYEEAKEVYAVEVGKVYEVVRQQTLEQMRSYIKSGNMDAAIAAAKAMYPEKAKTGEHGMEEHPAQNIEPLQTQSSVQPVQSVGVPQEVTQPVQPVSAVESTQQVEQSQSNQSTQSVQDQKGGQV